MNAEIFSLEIKPVEYISFLEPTQQTIGFMYEVEDYGIGRVLLKVYCKIEFNLEGTQDRVILDGCTVYNLTDCPDIKFFVNPPSDEFRGAIIQLTINALAHLRGFYHADIQIHPQRAQELKYIPILTGNAILSLYDRALANNDVRIL